MTVTSPATFTAEDALAASAAAEELVGERVEGLRARIEGEASEAIAAATEYATHLAAGGSPAKYPDTQWTSNSRLVTFIEALRPVYETWNSKRGGLHDVQPFRNKSGWMIAEALTEEVGTPVTYAILARLGRGSTRLASDDVAKAALAVEGPELVVRRTKVGGKVAYFARRRVESDPAEKSYYWLSIPEESL